MSGTSQIQVYYTDQKSRKMCGTSETYSDCIFSWNPFKLNLTFMNNIVVPSISNEHTTASLCTQFEDKESICQIKWRMIEFTIQMQCQSLRLTHFSFFDTTLVRLL